MNKLRSPLSITSIWIELWGKISESKNQKIVFNYHKLFPQRDASSVRYTVLTESRYLVMSWTEQAMGNGTKCGLCKYSLSPDLDTLASVRDFASLHHNIKSLTCFGGIYINYDQTE